MMIPFYVLLSRFMCNIASHFIFWLWKGRIFLRRLFKIIGWWERILMEGKVFAFYSVLTKLK